MTILIIMYLYIYVASIYCKSSQTDGLIHIKSRNRLKNDHREIFRQRALRPSRAGPGGFITYFDYMVKDKHFLFHKPYKKINLFRCFKIPYNCGKKLSHANSFAVIYFDVPVNCNLFTSVKG